MLLKNPFYFPIKKKIIRRIPVVCWLLLWCYHNINSKATKFPPLSPWEKYHNTNSYATKLPCLTPKEFSTIGFHETQGLLLETHFLHLIFISLNELSWPSYKVSTHGGVMPRQISHRIKISPPCICISFHSHMAMAMLWLHNSLTRTRL